MIFDTSFFFTAYVTRLNNSLNFINLKLFKYPIFKYTVLSFFTLRLRREEMQQLRTFLFKTSEFSQQPNLHNAAVKFAKSPKVGSRCSEGK